MIDYYGFNYEEFYKFIIDFFKVDQSLEEKATTTELYNWWNMYVSKSASNSGIDADTFPGRYSQSLP